MNDRNKKKRSKRGGFRLLLDLLSALLFTTGLILGILAFLLASEASPSGETKYYIYEKF